MAETEGRSDRGGGGGGYAGDTGTDLAATGAGRGWVMMVAAVVRGYGRGGEMGRGLSSVRLLVMVADADRLTLDLLAFKRRCRGGDDGHDCCCCCFCCCCWETSEEVRGGCRSRGGGRSCCLGYTEYVAGPLLLVGRR